MGGTHDTRTTRVHQSHANRRAWKSRGISLWILLIRDIWRSLITFLRITIRRQFIRNKQELRFDLGLDDSRMIQYIGFPGATLAGHLEDVCDFEPGTNDAYQMLVEEITSVQQIPLDLRYVATNLDSTGVGIDKVGKERKSRSKMVRQSLKRHTQVIVIIFIKFQLKFVQHFRLHQ